MFKRFFCKFPSFNKFFCFLTVLLASFHLIAESQAIDDKDWQGNPLGVLDRELIRQVEMHRKEKGQNQSTISNGEGVKYFEDGDGTEIWYVETIFDFIFSLLGQGHAVTNIDNHKHLIFEMNK